MYDVEFTYVRSLEAVLCSDLSFLFLGDPGQQQDNPVSSALHLHRPDKHIPEVAYDLPCPQLRSFPDNLVSNDRAVKISITCLHNQRDWITVLHILQM